MAFLVALAFAVAASANLPVIVLSIFWRRFNTAGAVAGLGVGLLASIGLILVSPSLMAIDPATVIGTARHLIQAKAWFPLENPGILSIPLGFLGAVRGNADQPRADLAAQVQRVAGAFEYRVGSGEGDGALRPLASTIAAWAFRLRLHCLLIESGRSRFFLAGGRA